jgi:hypothetical protein
LAITDLQVIDQGLGSGKFGAHLDQRRLHLG